MHVDTAQRLLDAMIKIALELKREIADTALEPVSTVDLLEHRGAFKEPSEDLNEI